MTHSYPTRRSSDLLDIGSTGENAVVDGIALGDHRCPHARLIGGKTTRPIQPPVAFRIRAALLLPPQRIVKHRHRAVPSPIPDRQPAQRLAGDGLSLVQTSIQPFDADDTDPSLCKKQCTNMRTVRIAGVLTVQASGLGT